MVSFPVFLIIIKNIDNLQDEILICGESPKYLSVVLNKVLTADAHRIKCYFKNKTKKQKKYVFYSDEVDFLGHIFGRVGVSFNFFRKS